MIIPPTSLLIRLTPGLLQPKYGVSTVNEIRGGPETLLRWLETQLGLPSAENHRASCVTEYASVIDSIRESVFSTSMSNDRWSTASDLLARRDELQLSGWDQTELDGLPEVVRDMASAANGRKFVFLSVADRIQRVADALRDGQQLPEHICVLTESPDCWPKRWQSILAHMRLEEFTEITPNADEGTALRYAQNVVWGMKAPKVELDATLRYVHTLSQTAAVEFVAATLSHKRDQLERTIILCEDDQLAMQVDACLARYGLPTMGATACSAAHPVLQVLPLTLALCWQPVNPQCVLDFLTLPISPIPRRAATALANALTVEPGIGSSEWKVIFDELCSKKNDSDGKLRESLEAWLLCDRVHQHAAMPTRLIRDRCAAVAQWAVGLAIAMENVKESDSLLTRALKIAAGQASLLGELAQSQGRELSEPQLARLIEEVLSSGVETMGAIEADGGPIRVRSLSEIVDPCCRVIWLGLATSDASSCRWSTEQLEGLRRIGIIVDDGTNSLTSLRTAEARGLCQIEDSLLAVLLPQDMEKRWHPVWLAIRTILDEKIFENPPVLENLIRDEHVSSLEPFTFATESVEVEGPHPSRPIWAVAPELLSDRESASATELEDRLACPLKWVFRHRAQLRPSSIARLPDDYRLKGSFCHRILEYAFGDGGDLPSVEEAVTLVERLFDERLALDAAPLAQSDRYQERQKLRKELANATRVLISALASGGYRIKGIEIDVDGHAFGKPLVGSIDCLVENQDGAEGIIDFKYGGKKYEDMIAEGKAVQLATYAYSRSVVMGHFPAVAYLILADGILFTPASGPIGGQGSHTFVDGPQIQTVWNHFQTAITNADEWLMGDGSIPARPLQSVELWPKGATMVLKTSLKENAVQAVCKYCDFQHLCGLRQLK
jgi:ATP-dependent helicase/nuclease subunit B